jgi:hypothetical protein
MKNKKALFTSALAILISSALIFSCEKDDTTSAKEKVFYDAKVGTSFNLEDQNQLNQLATTLSREAGEIKILTNASVVDLTDSKGDFKAISFRYQVGDLITKMIVPVDEVSFDKTGLKSRKGTEGKAYYMVMQDACEMKCTSVYPCSTCTQEIIERCKSQSCACNNMTEGCSASIVFPAN